MWVSLLRDMGCDNTAVADWFALASHSRGWDKAMALLHKIAKTKVGWLGCNECEWVHRHWGEECMARFVNGFVLMSSPLYDVMHRFAMSVLCEYRLTI